MPEPLSLEETNCFCGAHDVSSSAIHVKEGEELFTYHTCAVCGAQRLSPRPRAEAMGDYYPHTYGPYTVRPDSFSARMRQLIYLAYYAPMNRLGLFRPLLRLLLYPLRFYTLFAFHAVIPRQIFEFGAAAGNDLALFQAEGWDVAGCEPSARACAIAAERGIVLQNLPAEAVELLPNSVSCILINHVLEHIYDPARVLATCWRGLVPGGSLVVVVPNHASLTALVFGAAWLAYDAPRHLWGFTPDSLSALICQAGFLPPVVHNQAQGRGDWEATLYGYHCVTPVAAWRRRWAHVLSFLLVPVGLFAALLPKRGDIITVVATKPAV